jgi:hypothetical protein
MNLPDRATVVDLGSMSGPSFDPHVILALVALFLALVVVLLVIAAADSPRSHGR